MFYIFSCQYVSDLYTVLVRYLSLYKREMFPFSDCLNLFSVLREINIPLSLPFFAFLSAVTPILGCHAGLPWGGDSKSAIQKNSKAPTGQRRGWGCSLLTYCLPSIHGALYLTYSYFLKTNKQTKET